MLQKFDATMSIEHRRRIADLEQRARISLVGQSDNEVSSLARPLQRTFGRLAYARRTQRIQRRLAHCASELGVRSGEHGLRQAKLLQETANRRSTEARGKREL